MVNQAYKEMLRVTKPNGGVVANRESDLTMWSYYPELPGIRKTQECTIGVIKASGGNTNAGPRMVGWAMKAGARREQMDQVGLERRASTSRGSELDWSRSVREDVKHRLDDFGIDRA